MLRLDKYLADMQVGTRKEVKKLLKDKRIKVNDIIITKADYKLKNDDLVYFDDELIEYLEYEYIILNKPSGYLSATYDKYNPTIMDLVKTKRKDLFPCGRLDKDTEGLILLTNDGALAHYLLAPKSHIAKKYYVKTIKPLSKDAIKILEAPMKFKEFVTKGAKIEIINEYESYITISEGKYHQIKRMYERVNAPLSYLKRISMAFLNLDGLDIGESRYLNKEEITKLKALMLKEDE